MVLNYGTLIKFTFPVWCLTAYLLRVIHRILFSFGVPWLCYNFFWHFGWYIYQYSARLLHLQRGNDNRIASSGILKGMNGDKPQRTRGVYTPIARFTGLTWGPSEVDRTQEGPMLAQWTMLSGQFLDSCTLFTMYYMYIYCNKWVFGWTILFEISQSFYLSHVSLSSADFVYIQGLNLVISMSADAKAAGCQ